MIFDYLRSSQLNATFEGWPRLLDRELYLNIRDRNIIRLQSLSGVNNVYACGNIDTPGISDLDFLMTIDGSQFEKKELLNLYDCFDEDERYTIGCHFPFIVPIGWDDKYHHILPLSNSRLWLNSSFVDSTIMLDKNKLLPILAELLINLYPQTFFIPVMRQHYHVRKCVMALKAFRYPLHFAREISEDQQFGLKFEDKLTHFKDNFFSLSRTEVKHEIIDLMQQALSLSFRLLHYVGNTLDCQILPKYQGIEAQYSTLNIIFKDLPASHMQNYMGKIYLLTGRYLSILPTSFGCYCYGAPHIQRTDLSSDLSYRFKLIDDYGDFMFFHSLDDLIIWPPYLKNRQVSRTKMAFMRLARFMIK